MDISARGISVNANQTVSFQGDANQAAQLLAEIGVSLRSSRGQGVQSGFLRLRLGQAADSSGAQTLTTGLRRIRNTGSNRVATDLVRQLVVKVAAARGQDRAVTALDNYLRESSNRIGSQSFIKLLQAMEIDDGKGSISQMQPVGGRLVTEDILEPSSEAPDPGQMQFEPASSESLSQGLGGQPPQVDASQPRTDAIALPSAQPSARPILSGQGNTWDLLKQIGLSAGKKLGQGSFGVVMAARNAQGKETCAVKLMKGGQEERIRFSPSGKLQRSGEIIAAYLEKSDDPGYGASLSVVRPEYMMIRQYFPPDAEQQAAGQDGRAETLLVPREQLKPFLHAHGQKVANGQPVPQLAFKGTVMPLIAYGDLEHAINKAPLSEAGTAMLFYKGIDTLMGLGSRGLIHRDIKPANVFFDEGSGELRLADFGLMKKRSKAEEQGPPDAIQRSLGGTAGYMHPAVVGGNYGPEVDLFSFAITALEARHPDAMGLVYKEKLKPITKALMQNPALVPQAKIDRQAFIDLVDDVEDKIDDRIHLTASQKKRVLNQMDALLNVSDQPEPTAESFALACLEQASRPTADWATRDLVLERYRELLQHPYMREVIDAIEN
jgi:serine/threonine protein kinase